MTNINPFYSAKCTNFALANMQEIREAYKTLNDILLKIKNDKDSAQELVVGDREFEKAITNLEQSSMWAIKSISHYNVAE